MIEAPIPRSTLLRLQRAELHLGSLREEITSYSRNRVRGRGERPSKPYRLVRKQNPERSGDDLVFEVIEPLPDTVPLLASEIVHHLRSALDNLIYHLAGDPPLTRYSSLQFPLFGESPADRSQARLYEKILLGVGEDAKGIVDDLQPHVLLGGDEVSRASANRLLQLADLSNIDKHRVLPIALAHRVTTTVGSMDPGPDPFATGTRLINFQMLKHNTVVQECIPDDAPTDHDVFCDVVVDDGWPDRVAGQSLWLMLSGILLTLQTFVIPRFETLT